MLASHVGAAMKGCSWVGVPFAGGMSELPEIAARTIVVNDLHRWIINCARVVADDELRKILVRALRRKAFHPDELRDAQEYCKAISLDSAVNVIAAENYFVCCWMGRSSKAGIDDEFNGRPAIRWKADGGDSMVRFRSAIRMLATFSKTLRRCTFETMDAFDFLERCEDIQGHAIYADPPFPKVGRRYKHNAGQTDAEERAWHTRLRDALARFKKTRVVCRFYEHPLISELYANWIVKPLAGRKQTNEDAPEILVMNQEVEKSLF